VACQVVILEVKVILVLTALLQVTVVELVYSMVKEMQLAVPT
jgi:hypothetical protein